MIALVLTFILIWQTTPGEEARVHLERGMELYRELELDGAKTELEQAIELGLPPEEAVVAYRTLGLIHMADGLEDEAEKAFLELLKIKPDYEIGEVAPKVRAVFEKAKAKADVQPPRIEHSPIKKVKPGTTVAITAKVTDNARVKRVVLRFKGEGTKGFAEVEMQRVGDNRYVGRIPAERVAKGRLEYRIAAIDGNGNESEGRWTVRVEEGRSWLKIAGGTGLVGGVLGGAAYLILNLLGEKEVETTETGWNPGLPPNPPGR